MATLKRAFNGQSLPGLVLKILRGKYPPLPARYSGSLKGLVDCMLKLKPQVRYLTKQRECHVFNYTSISDVHVLRNRLPLWLWHPGPVLLLEGFFVTWHNLETTTRTLLGALGAFLMPAELPKRMGALLLS